MKGWRWFVAALFLALSAAGGRSDTRRIRATTEWEELRTQLLLVPTTKPGSAGKLSEAVTIVEGGQFLVEEDLFDLIQVNGLVGKAIGNPYPADLVTAFDRLEEKLAQFADGALQDFQDEIDTFVAANPDKSVVKQRKALEKARDAAVAAALKPTAATRAVALRKAIAKIRKVKVFPYVKNPPKGCPMKLDPGESAFGPWAIYDFTSQSVEPYYFEANWGSARITRNAMDVVTALSVDFGYCNGQNTGIVNLQFDIANPALGTYGLGSSVGGFQRGPGFVVNLTAASQVTIDFFDPENGVVGGSYSFSATNGAGTGSGSFLLRIDNP
jgi:hypothetical protein